MRSLATVALVVTVIGCRRDDGAPVPAPRVATRDGGAPDFDEAALRARIPGIAAGDAVTRLSLRAPLDVVLARVVRGEGPSRVVAVDRERVWEGLAGASRVLRAWRATGYAPFTEDLARVVGAFAFPDAAVQVARTVVEVDGGPVWVPGPTLARWPDGDGHALGFAYLRGGVVRAARFHLTARGEVVDAALTGRAGATENPPR